MIISEDGEHAFVLERKKDIFPLDLISVDLEERVAIGQHPNYLTYLRIKDIGKFIGIVTVRYICKLRKF
jgi:hypothetical protein